MSETKNKKLTVDYAIEILEDLIRILKERGATYASIEDNSLVFDAIMDSLGIKLPENMSSTQYHCLSNIATKLSRITTGDRFYEDSYLDIANYAILIAAYHRKLKVEQ